MTLWINLCTFVKKSLPYSSCIDLHKSTQAHWWLYNIWKLFNYHRIQSETKQSFKYLPCPCQLHLFTVLVEAPQNLQHWSGHCERGVQVLLWPLATVTHTILIENVFTCLPWLQPLMLRIALSLWRSTRLNSTTLPSQCARAHSLHKRVPSFPPNPKSSAASFNTYVLSFFCCCSCTELRTKMGWTQWDTTPWPGESCWLPWPAVLPYCHHLCNKWGFPQYRQFQKAPTNSLKYWSFTFLYPLSNQH